ncbi:5-oxoprolinase subunit A [Sporomusa carbonis]|uniref:LamB/YcsF family protein n=1 Tax=Sporomusa carbonis TaxID=3076075 RepID=UPI003A678609
MRIDLNCDMGESFGVYTLGHDEAAMPYVTSINVACGFHASDPSNILKTIKKAKQYNLAIGAHPSFPDLVGFGRRALAASKDEIYADVVYQIGALIGMCKSEGLTLQHVKAHGALYNMAEKDINVAAAIAEAIRRVDPTLYMVCSCGSVMVQAAQAAGVKYVEEAFADRAYTKDGTLVPRRQSGAVIHNTQEVADRVLNLIKTGNVKAIDGSEVVLKAQTICVHGDTPGAVDMIKEIRAKLIQEGITVSPFGK